MPRQAPAILFIDADTDVVKRLKTCIGAFEVVLLGVGASWRRGLVRLRQVRADPRVGTLPLIVTGCDDSEVACYLDAGASDVAPASITRAALNARVRTQRRIGRELGRLRALATRDELTGVDNRRAILEMLRAELARGRRSRSPVTVFCIDVDDLKVINDGHGHQAGDEVIRAIAGCLQQAIRTSDRLGRIGGDEFLLVVPGADADAAELIASRLREAVSTLVVASCPHPLSISIGSAAATGSETDIELLLERADAAMYGDKRGRRASRRHGAVAA